MLGFHNEEKTLPENQWQELAVNAVEPDTFETQPQRELSADLDLEPYAGPARVRAKRDLGNKAHQMYMLFDDGEEPSPEWLARRLKALMRFAKRYPRAMRKLKQWQERAGAGDMTAAEMQSAIVALCAQMRVITSWIGHEQLANLTEDPGPEPTR